MIAKVVVNVPSSNTDQFYDYILPDEFVNFAKVGSRVKVPYGPANREIMGFIMELIDNSSYRGDLKAITEVVDYEPVINDELIDVAKFIKEDAVCPLIRILNLMIPDALKIKTKKYLAMLNYKEIDARLIDIFSKKEMIEYTPELKKFDSIIAKEVQKGNLKVTYEAKQIVKDKMITKYILNKNYTYQNFKDLKRESQKEFLESLYNEIPLTKEELIEKYDVSLYTIISLAKKGYLDKIEEKALRIKIRNIPVQKRIRTSDNFVINELMLKLNDYDKPLLFVPKNESQQLDAILQIINFNQKNGKNTVIIVPEILTSYNIENSIRKLTGLSVALINSNLSYGELLDYYNEIKNDAYSVIVTTSKGALYPYCNVGSYILLDSESDNYYNDQSPRYDLHKVIEHRAKYSNSKVIRMSFVPLVLEYTYALKGYLNIVEDFEKKNNLNVEVIDLKNQLQMGNNSSLSDKLIREIKLAKARNEKSILIVNNKGYSSYIMCRTCGKIIKCPRCQISLQYNKKSEMLICPACSNRTKYENHCPSCGSKELKLGGVGIEQVCEDLNELLPNIKIESLISNDFDKYAIMNESLEDDTLDVIVTTENFARNIISSRIGLVAIVNIDTISKMADYDATFRAYSALVHAGSKINTASGKLIIQTYNPTDEYIKDYLVGDYHTFIRNEVVTRKILKNEPYYFVNRIVVKGKYEEMFKEAHNIKQNLIDHYGKNVFIIGPTYNYHYQAVQIIIKHKINQISEFYQEIYEKYQSSTLMILIDKYPKYI